MKTIYTLLIISLSCTFYSSAQNKEISLYLSHYYNGETINLDDTLSFEDGINYNISRLEYYLTINTLRATNGDSIVYPGEFYTSEDSLINYSGKQLLVNTQKNKYSLGLHDISDLNTMQFHVGVPAEINHQDPTIWPSSHPLAPKTPSMHWGWAAGYRFIAFEAMVDEDSDSIFETVLQYHGVGDTLYRAVNRTVNTEETEEEIIIYLDVNYEELLLGINASSGGVFHGEHEQVMGLMDNFANNEVFTNTENMSLKSTLPANNISPNPFSNSLSIKLEKPSQLKVYSILGKLVYERHLVVGSNTIVTQKLKEGLYIFHLENEDSIKSYKLLKN